MFDHLGNFHLICVWTLPGQLSTGISGPIVLIYHYCISKLRPH